MNQAIPISPATSVEAQNDNARIAVAVFFWPDTFNHLAHVILQNAILAGLHQRSAELRSQHGYFRNCFSVQVFEVASGLKERTITALEETLATLNLKERSIFAKLTDVMAQKEGMERIERNERSVEWMKQNLAEILTNPNFGK
jgi:hypothetical protein